MTRAQVFRARCRLHVFAPNLDWLNGLSVSFLIGQYNDLRFSFTTLKSKRLYTHESRAWLEVQPSDYGSAA